MQITFLSALAMATSVSAHALMYGASVNGVDQGNGQKVYIRSPPNNSPVKDLTSPNIVCGVNGATAAPKFVNAAAGDTLTFEWYHNTRSDDIIDGSHKGPIITWIAEYTDGAATGPIWSKIAEDGYDGSQWAVQKLIANKGKIDFKLPSSLAAGQYLIRQEIIAHHESESRFDQNPARGAQFYPSCVQVEVTGSGSTVPNQGFDFNKDYTYADPGINFNIYTSFSSYPIPGPAVFSGSGSGSGSGNGGSSPASTSKAAGATSKAATSIRPAPTTAAGGSGSGSGSGSGNGNQNTATRVPVASATTLATVVSPPPSVPATTRGNTSPVNTSAPQPKPCRRRRRRNANKAKKNAM